MDHPTSNVVVFTIQAMASKMELKNHNIFEIHNNNIAVQITIKLLPNLYINMYVIFE